MRVTRCDYVCDYVCDQVSDQVCDQVCGEVDDVDAGGAGGLSCSVEALSLIPGRDINHEGPHRVYQWTDF